MEQQREIAFSSRWPVKAKWCKNKGINQESLLVRRRRLLVPFLRPRARRRVRLVPKSVDCALQTHLTSDDSLIRQKINTALYYKCRGLILTTFLPLCSALLVINNKPLWMPEWVMCNFRDVISRLATIHFPDSWKRKQLSWSSIPVPYFEKLKGYDYALLNKVSSLFWDVWPALAWHYFSGRRELKVISSF